MLYTTTKLDIWHFLAFLMSTRKQQTARSNSGADADELRCELRDLRAELQALKTQKQTLRQTDTEEHPARHGGTSTSSYIWMEGFLLLTVCNIVFYAWANNFVDGLLGIERISAHPTAAAGKIDFGPVVMLLPLLGLMYQDLQHNASKKFFTAVPDRIMNYVLRVVGGYGIVQASIQYDLFLDASAFPASTHTPAQQARTHADFPRIPAHARTHARTLTPPAFALPSRFSRKIWVLPAASTSETSCNTLSCCSLCCGVGHLP